MRSAAAAANFLTFSIVFNAKIDLGALKDYLDEKELEVSDGQIADGTVNKSAIWEEDDTEVWVTIALLRPPCRAAPRPLAPRMLRHRSHVRCVVCCAGWGGTKDGDRIRRVEWLADRGDLLLGQEGQPELCKAALTNMSNNSGSGLLSTQLLGCSVALGGADQADVCRPDGAGRGHGTTWRGEGLMV